MSLGDKLKQLRAENKRTQQQLAKYLSISQAAYSKYECGLSEPDSNSLKLLAEYYGVSIDYLLGKIDTESTIGINEIKSELARLGIDGDLAAQTALLKKINNLTPEQKKIILTIIDNFKE